MTQQRVAHFRKQLRSQYQNFKRATAAELPIDKIIAIWERLWTKERVNCYSIQPSTQTKTLILRINWTNDATKSIMKWHVGETKLRHSKNAAQKCVKNNNTLKCSLLVRYLLRTCSVFAQNFGDIWLHVQRGKVIFTSRGTEGDEALNGVVHKCFSAPKYGIRRAQRAFRSNIDNWNTARKCIRCGADTVCQECESLAL